MRNRVVILTLSIFIALTFAVPPLADAQWKTNSVVNLTTDPLYVVYSTWYGASQGFPRGYRTRGYYKVDAGNRRTFQAWSNNSIYFQIHQNGETLKPKTTTETFGFWVHPSRAFTVVSQRMNGTVSRGQLTHSSPGSDTLAKEDGFIRYVNGSELKVDSSWVPVSGIAETDPGAALSVDVNGDGVVDAADVAYVAARLNQQGTSADVNGDGRVTVLDLQLVSDAIGTDVGGIPSGVPQKSVTEGMVLIPAGEFRMGNNEFGGTQPVHSVYVDAFYMDKYEVTNSQYAKFLNAQDKHTDAGITLAYLGSDLTRIEYVEGKYRAKLGYENHPMVVVNWYAAMAYAEWIGKRLPTEAEWEKAARGGLSGLKYPWGNTIDSSRANYNWHIDDTTAVGKYPPNGYGLYDMIGNVWEWCLDEYSTTFYAISPARNPLSGANSIKWILNNYIGIKSHRVMRGGSYASAPGTNAWEVTVSGRFGYLPVNAARTGFRCVRAVSP